MVKNGLVELSNNPEKINVVHTMLITQAMLFDNMHRYEEAKELTDMLIDLDELVPELSRMIFNLDYEVILYVIQLRSSVKLGLVENAQQAYYKLLINGIDPEQYIGLHTEFFTSSLGMSKSN